MSPFAFSKVEKYRFESRLTEDVVDIRFPSELKEERLKKSTTERELLVFIVEDDPFFLQILNTHLSKLQLHVKGTRFTFKVKNFATGRSCLKNLNLSPDLIFLNFYINDGLHNSLTGREILDQIIGINPNQKVLILNELEEKLRGAFVEDGLRDYIIKDEEGLIELNCSIAEILDQY